MLKNKKILILIGAILLLIILNFYLFWVPDLNNNKEKEENLSNYFSEDKTDSLENKETLKTYTELKEVNYLGNSFNVYLDIPKSEKMDYVVVFHGTTKDDTIINDAAQKIAASMKNIISKDVGIISVAYPQRNMDFKDNIKIPEAALLWVQNQAEKDLNIKIDRTFLIGHSLGGYIVTRLNTVYKTDGVIANAPGPIDLAFTCKVLENVNFGEKVDFCSSMKERYGSASSNPSEYTNQSLISFVAGQKSKILFIQGLNDNKKQVDLMKTFEEKMNQCKNCADSNFIFISGADHGAIIESEKGINAVNDFLK
jgi:alpha/beta superfamily hydrolase